MGTWQVQQAKARLSEVIDEAESKGPQKITRRGVETAVVVSISDWKILQPSPQPEKKTEMTMLELLQSHGRFDIPLPDRHAMIMRKVKPL